MERDLRDETIEHNEANPRSTHSSGYELHQATRRGDLELVMRLIQNDNFDPMEKDQNGDTALHCAAEGGNLAVLKFLIEESSLNPACLDFTG